MTDPPIVGDLGVAVGRRFGAPVLVISQDVFPEIPTELDRLRNPVVVGILGTLVGAYLRRADRIVAIGETMRERLEANGAPAERLRVIPNWVDTRAITPQPRDNPWAERHGLVSRFVVMHSGNVGHAQDLDSLVRAATFLRDRDDIRIVIAGFGEETLFRGYLFERLGRLLGGSAIAKAAILVGTSVLFGAAHGPEQGIAGVQQAMIVGLAYGGLYLASGTLVLPMIVHTAFNLTAIAIIYADLETTVARWFFR